MNLRFCLLWMLSGLCVLCASEAQRGLRLHVDTLVIIPRLAAKPPDGRGNPRIPAANLFVENCGTTSVTLPSRIPPDGAPSGVSQAPVETGDRREVWYIAALDRRDGKELQPSPNSFEPVTLAPGEIARVAIWRPEEIYEKTLPDDFHRVTFRFIVEKKLAAKFGWWSGELSAQVDFFEAAPQTGRK